MTSRPPAPRRTPRNAHLLAALGRRPLTAEQLLKFSQTAEAPFTTARRVREHLQRLQAAGWVRTWRYALDRPGTLNYYTLTRLGHQILRGPEAPLPPRHTFLPVGRAREPHAHALADFIVQAAGCGESSLIGHGRSGQRGLHQSRKGQGWPRSRTSGASWFEPRGSAFTLEGQS